MAIELLDNNTVWSKIKAGFRGGVQWMSPARAKNPTGYKDGIDPLATRAVMDNKGPMKGTSAFGGKTFSSRK